jgi:hypothetical protein
MHCFCVFAVGLFAVSAAAQQLTPREIFYGQNRPAAKAEAPKAKRAPAPATPPAASPAKSSEDMAHSNPQPAPVKDEAQRAKVVNVAETVRPLGLKYTLLKRTEAGEYNQVDPDSTFVNGDQIRLTIETNDSGYLYVVTQGTSRLWKPLFPSPEIAGGDNRVVRGKRYNIPSDSVFSFSGAAGTEKLFVVLSRQPEGDIRNLMYKLEDRQQESREPAHAMLAANIGIQDSLIQRLRTTYARDLVIEKVDDTKASAPAARVESSMPVQEKAMYVVNPKAGDKAWVVADIDLRHE